MKLLSIDDYLPAQESTVLTVGNFDGVHRGHQLLIKQVVDRARQRGVSSALVTFEPHTRAALFPELPQHLLTTFEEKYTLIEKSGIDYLFKIPFDKSFSETSPESFVEYYLLSRFHMVEWIMGEGHAIGKNRSGGKNFLRDTVSKYHIPIFTANLLQMDSLAVSSTRIRKLITEGCLSEAMEMLGHPYLISVERIEGLKIGSQIGYPTLNFKRPPSQKVIPPPGVYAAELEFNDTLLTGALYFGACPTFNDRESHFEFHALDLKGTTPQVEQTAHIWVYRFMRSDQAFSNTEELVRHIQQDINQIRIFFKRRDSNGVNQGTQKGINQYLR